MKKVFLVPLFAVGFLASSAGAVVCTSSGGGSFCQFGTGCFEMSDEYSDGVDCKAPNCSCAKVIENCELYGSVFKGVTGLTEANGWGKDLKCANQGGTWTNEGKNPNRTALGCCNWDDGTNECWTIWSGEDSDGEDGETKVATCKGGNNQFWNGQCSNEPSCPTSTPVYDGKNPQDGFCCWEGNDSNNGNGYCGPIDGNEITVSSCTNDYGSVVQSCSGCRTQGTPILSGTSSVAGLTVLAQSGSLHISALKEATVALFDMTGKQVFSEKVPAGYSTLSLKNQKQGVYFAVVSSGSSKQTVRVVLK
jgi:hypothetical protein